MTVRSAALLPALLLAAACGGSAPAVEPWPPSPPDEVEAVKAVVIRLFDAMRAHDGAMARSVFHPDARFVSVGEDEAGRVTVSTQSTESFVTSVGRPGEPWDERVTWWQVNVDGRVASVWNGYTFHLGERFTHCGIDSFEMVKDDGGWVITQLTDTRTPAERCP